VDSPVRRPESPSRCYSSSSRSAWSAGVHRGEEDIAGQRAHLTHGKKSLLEIASDPLVHRLRGIAKSVHRDIHKMHAYVRFRKAEVAEGGECFVA
jgi:hypothetical protein